MRRCTCGVPMVDRLTIEILPERHSIGMLERVRSAIIEFPGDDHVVFELGGRQLHVPAGVHNCEALRERIRCVLG